jgi:hypothetical protein
MRLCNNDDDQEIDETVSTSAKVVHAAADFSRHSWKMTRRTRCERQ